MKTVVIDPGHGGKDPGNLGTGRYKTKEKDIALAVALRLGDYISEQFPELNVLYTRKTDIFIGLNERAEIANKADADLFISIHCNAFTKSSSNGVETFVLGLHRNEENLQVAMTENSAIFLEEDYETKYEGFDPNSPESIIALTIMQSAFLQQSLNISAKVQQQFRDRVGRRDRGVKQAGFLVLRRTTMPSILIELGFLTNPSEEDFLNSENGQVYMASAIFRGFKDYKKMVEDPLPEPPVTEKETASEDDLPEQDEATSTADSTVVKAAKEREAAVQDSILKAQRKASMQARLDSLAALKAQLEERKKAKEEAAKKAEEEKKALLKARADSLQAAKQKLLEERQKREEELRAEQAAKEEAAKEEAERKALEQKQQQEEELRKAEEAKRTAQEWLEEIKEEKERELEEKRKQAAIAEEKKRLEALNELKQEELDTVKDQTEEEKELERIALQQIRQDSVEAAKAAAAQREAYLASKQKESENVSTSEKQKVVIDNRTAVTPEEAEILFLQLRKKQLEERIARLKGDQKKTPSEQPVGEQPVAKVDEKEPRNEQTTETAPPPKVTAEQHEPGSGISLRVQVLTSETALALDDQRFKGQEVLEYQQSGLYKYTVGNSRSFEEIAKLQAEMRQLGFSGAFVVAFLNEERIKVSEARELLNE